MTRQRWWDRHPFFVRFYVPLVVTASLVVQLWEAAHR